MNVAVLSCPTCGEKWRVGANVGDLERQSLESVPCPHCGGHSLRVVTTKPLRERFLPRMLRMAVKFSG